MSPLPESQNVAPEAPRTTSYGEVFTRRWVVDFILDLSGYTADRDLVQMKVIEPACGSGAFLVAMIERLMDSALRFGHDLKSARESIYGQDLLASNVEASRAAAIEALVSAGVGSSEASFLSRGWIQQGDFLLEPPQRGSANFVIGNPPYLRLEAVPTDISDAYRKACSTMGGRSDVYVGFFEQGLQALLDDGVLGFICADRWMRNAYGSRLRELIASDWSLDAIVSMTGVDAFEEQVDAYPAITVLRRGEQTSGPLVVDTKPEFGPQDAKRLAKSAGGQRRPPQSKHFQAARLKKWFSGGAGWPSGSPDSLAVLADLETRLPSLEDTGTETRVGIGLATGADRVFIVEDPTLVEPERALRLAMVRDIATGELQWSGRYLVNPWDPSGLVELGAWPQMEHYLGRHRATLSKRHTAKSGRWHKTIDRVIDGLAERDKLYLPDFKEKLFPVIDRGETYPHHNLYWITSELWDLEVLGGILLSEVANLFVSAYSVRMRGGYLRFQAQYLRRIRVPRVDQIDEASAEALRAAFLARDRVAATDAALPLYGLDTVPA